MPVFAISRLTVLDLIRRRVVVILVLFAAGLILLSFPLRDLTIGQWRRLITDIGLGATDLSLVLISILIGATLVAGDLDRKTLYPLLSKPISRATFVFGRFGGLVVVVWTLCIAMVASTAVMLWFAKESAYGAVLLQNITTIGMTATVVGAISIFFSCFSSATLSAMASLAIAFAGHLTDNLAYFGGRVPSAFAKGVLLFFSKVLPNLEALNLKDFAAHAEAISGHDLGLRLAYGLGYAIVAVSLGALIFTRRDLK